jgi:hypothetical protein
MGNQSGKAYGLTVLCPLRSDTHEKQSFAAALRARLHALPLDEDSPMARVPNTYLCRLFVLDDVPYQGEPAQSERLKSKYLVFVCELHGQLETYLQGMWKNAEETINSIWEFCVGFKDDVRDADSFTRYIKKCQVTTTFYFNGSTDEPLAEQLKALYLKQEFSKFAIANQGKSAADVQRAFDEFVKATEPSNLARPSWRAGASRLDVA